jgi:hypothetical protein
MTEAPKRITTYTGSHSDYLSDESGLLQRLKVLEDEQTGIVTRSEKLFDSNLVGIRFHHFYDVTCYNPLRLGLTEHSSSDALLSKDNLVEPSPSGSGFSATEAEISALMEAVERYSSRHKMLFLLVYSILPYISVNTVSQRLPISQSKQMVTLKHIL